MFEAAKSLTDVNFLKLLKLMIRDSGADDNSFELVTNVTLGSVKDGSRKVDLPTVILVTSLVPYLCKAWSLQNAVQSMAKALTLNTSLGKIYEKNVADREAKAKYAQELAEYNKLVKTQIKGRKKLTYLHLLCWK